MKRKSISRRKQIKLTLKQEKFVNAYMETGNASEAYRRSYSVRPGTKEATINRTAFSLLRNPNITTILRQKQQELKKSSDIKKETILEELSVSLLLISGIMYPGTGKV